MWLERQNRDRQTRSVAERKKKKERRCVVKSERSTGKGWRVRKERNRCSVEEKRKRGTSVTWEETRERVEVCVTSMSAVCLGKHRCHSAIQ